MEPRVPVSHTPPRPSSHARPCVSPNTLSFSLLLFGIFIRVEQKAAHEVAAYHMMSPYKVTDSTGSQKFKHNQTFPIEMGARPAIPALRKVGTHFALTGWEDPSLRNASELKLGGCLASQIVGETRQGKSRQEPLRPFGSMLSTAGARHVWECKGRGHIPPPRLETWLESVVKTLRAPGRFANRCLEQSSDIIIFMLYIRKIKWTSRKP